MEAIQLKKILKKAQVAPAYRNYTYDRVWMNLLKNHIYLSTSLASWKYIFINVISYSKDVTTMIKSIKNKIFIR